MHVELIDITKKFGDVIAVNELNLAIKSKEILFLLGPSGCGKTTALRIIAGLERQDKGKVIIGGEDVSNLPPHKRGTSMVFQTWALFPHKKVFDNVAFGLRMKKLPRDVINKKVKEALELVNLSGYENRYPAQLSGGEQQRVALARALAIEPSVLLLDEPLSNLDYNLRCRMRLEIKKLQRKLGITTIFVTHDQTEALTMADRIAVMNKGEILEIGTPFELYVKPRTEFTANFIGERNILDGTVLSIDNSKITINTCEGLCLHASARELLGLSKGDKVKVIINPEEVELCEKGKKEEGQNLFIGIVENVEYQGSESKYEIRVENELLKLTEYNVGGKPRFDIGERVHVNVKKNGIHILKF